ncbi:MAG: substrate-binding domain-containing protein [Alphaproteobacteria bacterium]|nr:substrate-binding domain-containing protein [Alphaproteobacteria bacterium]
MRPGVLALLTGFVLMSCTAPPPPPKPEAAKPLLRIGGSDTMTHALVPALVDAHRTSKHTLDFEVTGGGSGAGFRQLLDGTLDVAASTRPHHDAENDQAKQLGFSLSSRGARTVIGVDVVAVVVHPSSPIRSLTYDQVIGIFCDKTIDDLSFLGLGNGPIRPVTRDLKSGTRSLFEDFFCSKGIHARIEMMSSEEFASAVGSDPSVISFASMAEGLGRTVPLRPVTESPPIEPSVKNIANGSYPLYRDLYLYTAGPASGNAKQFIDWVLSPAGQDIMDEQRFVPIYHRTKDFDGPRPLRETIHFESGEAMPNQRSMARIQLLVQELQQKGSKGQHIVLEGFTDSEEANPADLSRQRAETVRDLLDQQLEGMFFEIIPRGSIRPLAPNSTTYGRLRNRRVQIYLADEEADYGDIVVPADGSEPPPGEPG